MTNKNLEQAEAELLKDMPPVLVSQYNYVKNDLSGADLPEIIRDFQILKRDWTDEPHSWPIQFPDKEDLIIQKSPANKIKNFLRRVFKSGKI